MPHIVSTMTSPVAYTEWVSNPGGINIKKRHVLINGGHGVARRDPAGGLFTPNGVITKVTQEELDFLKTDSVFQQHLKEGAVKVISAVTPADKAVKDMSVGLDRPLTAKDSEKGGRSAIPDSMKINGGQKLQ